MLEIEKRFKESTEKLEQKLEIYANKIQNIETQEDESIHIDLEADSNQRIPKSKNKELEVKLSCF